MIDMNLKAWAHNVINNPIDEHQLAHAKATKELIEERDAYREALEFYTNRENWKDIYQAVPSQIHPNEFTYASINVRFAAFETLNRFKREGK